MRRSAQRPATSGTNTTPLTHLFLFWILLGLGEILVSAPRVDKIYAAPLCGSVFAFLTVRCNRSAKVWGYVIFMLSLLPLCGFYIYLLGTCSMDYFKHRYPKPSKTLEKDMSLELITCPSQWSFVICDAVIFLLAVGTIENAMRALLKSDSTTSDGAASSISRQSSEEDLPIPGALGRRVSKNSSSRVPLLHDVGGGNYKKIETASMFSWRFTNEEYADLQSCLSDFEQDVEVLNNARGGGQIVLYPNLHEAYDERELESNMTREERIAMRDLRRLVLELHDEFSQKSNARHDMNINSSSSSSSWVPWRRKRTELVDVYDDHYLKVANSPRFLMRLFYAYSSDDNSNFKLEDARNLLVRYIDTVLRDDLHLVKEEAIRKNYDAGFCCVAGRDLDGRPLVWIRCKHIYPKNIGLGVGIKSTWLALDAALQDMPSIRAGACFVYDVSGLGMGNCVGLPIADFAEAAVAVGINHNSRISKILFLDTPKAFAVGWDMALPVLPRVLTDRCTFIDTKENPLWYLDHVATREELPVYYRYQQDRQEGAATTETEEPRDDIEYLDWLKLRVAQDYLIFRNGQSPEL